MPSIDILSGLTPDSFNVIDFFAVPLPPLSNVNIASTAAPDCPSLMIDVPGCSIWSRSCSNFLLFTQDAWKFPVISNTLLNEDNAQLEPIEYNNAGFCENVMFAVCNSAITEPDASVSAASSPYHLSSP